MYSPWVRGLEARIPLRPSWPHSQVSLPSFGALSGRFYRSPETLLQILSLDELAG